MEKMDKYRCFVAIGIPDQVKKALAEIQKDLRAWPARVKWVEEKNFHLTLKFLGDVGELQIRDIEAGLVKACSRRRQFEILVSGLGAFPNARNPKVIWAGIQDPRKHLYSLWSDIEHELVRLGFAAETKHFSPHLTLGRIKDTKPAPGLGEILRSLQIKSHEIPVTEVKLMRSVLSRSGPEYSCLRSVFLQEHF